MMETRNRDEATIPIILKKKTMNSGQYHATKKSIENTKILKLTDMEFQKKKGKATQPPRVVEKGTTSMASSAGSQKKRNGRLLATAAIEDGDSNIFPVTSKNKGSTNPIPSAETQKNRTTTPLSPIIFEKEATNMLTPTRKKTGATNPPASASSPWNISYTPPPTVLFDQEEKEHNLSNIGATEKASKTQASPATSPKKRSPIKREENPQRQMKRAATPLSCLALTKRRRIMPPSAKSPISIEGVPTIKKIIKDKIEKYIMGTGAPEKKAIDNKIKCLNLIRIPEKLAPTIQKVMKTFVAVNNYSTANVTNFTKNVGCIAQQSLGTLKEKVEFGQLTQELINLSRELKNSRIHIDWLQTENARLNTIYKNVVKSEEHYEMQLSTVKEFVNKQAAQLINHQSQNSELERELKYMQQTNRDLAKMLYGIMQAYEKKLLEDQNIIKQFKDRNYIISNGLNSSTVEIQSLTAQKEFCEEKILHLESELTDCNFTCEKLTIRIEELIREYNTNSSKFQTKLHESESRRLELEQFTKELEVSRNETNSLKANVYEKETLLESLQNNIKQMDAKMKNLIKKNDDSSKEIKMCKFNCSQELITLKESHKSTVLELRSQLQSQINSGLALFEHKEKLEKDSKLQLSQLQGQLNECELQRNDLLKAKESLEFELQQKTLYFKDQLTSEQQKSIELLHQYQTEKHDFENEIRQHKDEIQALKAALEQSRILINDDQEKLKCLLSDRDKLQKDFFNLKDNTEKISNEFTAAKIKFAQELKLQGDSLHEKLIQLQLKIENKQTEMSEMERDKDNIIAELNYKMDRISSIFKHSVGTAAVLIQGCAPGDSQQSSLRKQRKRVNDAKHFSDFESDTDQSNNPVENKKGKVKRLRDSNDRIFDRLKKN